MKGPTTLAVLAVALTCAYASAVQQRDTRCPPTHTLDDPIQLPHADCSKFYKCDHGVIVEFNCPAGLQWSTAEDRCEWPENSDCGAIGGPPSEETSEDPTEETSEDPTEETSEDPIEETSEDPTEETSEDPTEETSEDPSGESTEAPANGCPPTHTPDDPIHLPHADCSKFYKCDHGVAVEFDCPAGLQWSTAEDRCEWPENSDCGAIGGPPSEETSEDPTEETSEDPTEETSEDPSGESTEAPPNDCPPTHTPDDPIQLPHPDCSKFYKCDHGVIVEFDCPAGLQWSTAEDRCEWPENSDCGAIGGPPSEETSEDPTEETSEDPTEETSEDPSGESTEAPPNDCPPTHTPDDPIQLPHPDCSKFYKCDHGVIVEFDCPAGLQWSTAEDRCEWPENSDCGAIGGPPSEETSEDPTEETSEDPTEETSEDPTEETSEDPSGESTEAPPNGCPPTHTPDDPIHLPHADCSKFYKCDHGVAVEFDCPAGLQWSTAEDRCEWPENSDCGAIGGPPSEETSEDPTEETSEDPTEETSEDPTEETSEDPTEETSEDPSGESTEAPPNDCPPTHTPDDPIQLPHPDCSKFYKCDHGVIVEFDCPAGLQWSTAEDRCEWPENSDCGAIGGPPSEETSEDPTEETSEDPTEETSEDPIEETSEDPTEETSEDPTEETSEDPSGESTEAPPNGCPPTHTPDDPIHLPHADCSKFYKCDHGVAVEFDCPAGLQWSTAEDRCEWPENSDCGAIGGPPSEETSEDPTEETSEDPTEETSEDPSGESTEAPPNDCPPTHTPDDPIQLPHPDCSKFYKCDHGVIVEFDCPAGLQWSTAEDRCEWPENSDCGAIGGPPSEETSEDPTEETSEDPTEETSEDPTEETSEDPSEETSEDPTEETSEDPSGESTEAPPNGCPPTHTPDDPIHLPHADCSKFYKCDHGVAVEFDCPAGLQWSTAEDRCEWPENSDCGAIGGPPSEETSEDPTEETSEDPTEETSEDPSGESTEAPPNDCPPTHTPDDPIQLPHPDCSKFYKCDHGVIVEFDCPAGLQWSTAEDRCEWPENSDCGAIGGPPSEETSEDPTEETSEDPTEETSEDPTEETSEDPTEETSEDPTEETSEDPSGESTEAPANGCPPTHTPDDPIHLPHADCSKFYKCDHGVAVEFDCPAGLQWSTAEDRCEWPENSDCGAIGGPLSEETSEDPTEETSEDPTEETSEDPIEETSEDPTEETSEDPTEETSEDPSSESTEKPTSAPGTSCPSASSEDDPIHLPHPDCHKFYKCDNGLAHEFNCPDGLLWSIWADRCEWEENSDCDGTAPVQPTWPPGTSSVAPPVVRPAACPADHTPGFVIHLPHPDCHKFYKCDHGVAVEFDCPDGLYWNVAADQCEYAADSDCASL